MSKNVFVALVQNRIFDFKGARRDVLSNHRARCLVVQGARAVSREERAECNESDFMERSFCEERAHIAFGMSERAQNSFLSAADMFSIHI